MKKVNETDKRVMYLSSVMIGMATNYLTRVCELAARMGDGDTEMRQSQISNALNCQDHARELQRLLMEVLK